MSGKVSISVTVNGKRFDREVEPRQLLVQFIREGLALTGTHIGCDTSYCGACTVLFNGEPVKSCTMLAVQADGGEVTTVEGLARDGKLHPLQESFSEHHALQCGYCTPGMLATAHDIVTRLPDADENLVRHELAGNLCRCTGYRGIVRAIVRVLNEQREQREQHAGAPHAA